MNDYDQQYYFIESPDNDSLPELSPDVNTEDRKFRYQRQAMGSPPLVFFNGSREYQQKMRSPSMKVPPDILFSACQKTPVFLKNSALNLRIQARFANSGTTRVQQNGIF